MVQITNGVETFTIPEGAVNTYKSMGFREVVDSVITKEVDVEEPTEEFTNVDELLKKPISQWNQAEVKEFAASKGYDVSGAKSLKQAKAIIKKALEEEEKALAEV